MPIKDATPEQIRAMKSRLSRKHDDRLADYQMDEAVRMARRRPASSNTAFMIFINQEEPRCRK